MNFRGRYKPEGASFQMTPMIDVVFLLLCFFVTSQMFAQWETEVDVIVPTAETGDVKPRNMGEIIINVRSDGGVVVNAQTLTDERLRSMLARVAEYFPDQAIVIRGDRKTSYEDIMRVVDYCRGADIYKISFATVAPE